MSLSQAIAAARDEAEAPLRGELDSVVRDLEVGVDVDRAFATWVERAGTDDARLLGAALTLHRRTGGDLPKVLDQIVGTIWERITIAREVRGLTAQARLSGLILGLLPVAFFGFLWVTSRRDMQAALSTPAGIAAVAVGAAMEGAAFLWIRQAAGGRVIGLAPWLAAATVLAVAWGTRAAMSARPPLSASSRSASAPGHPRTWRRRRPTSVDPEVPQLLDLLAAGSSAGLSAELALRRSADVMTGSLGVDLRAMFARTDLGARWRTELDAYATASGSRDLRRTVTVLERTERLGASLAESCADLAGSVRAGRRARRLERARTAPVKMLFPLVFLILPAFLLLTVVPVLLATVNAIA